MNFAAKGDMKIAVKVAYDTFAPLEAGVKTFERIIKPIVKTVRLISENSAQTEVVGYFETVKITADTVYGDNANEYLYSLAECVGRNCKTDIFLYSSNDETAVANTFSGKRYPVTAAVTKLCGESGDIPGFYGFEAEFYVNGSGITEEREILR
ncbi:MAG: hypothetical protein IKX78_01445 [Clostridia bacterium]|nr:hypothetical protein [Clostridia bacterium]